MAERRMFAKAIVSSGKFLRMPPTARLLYYDLGMCADDDGIVEAYTIMTQTKATEDDLRILIAKGYVKILNEDLVTLICDWNTNNSIRSDRYHPSIYKDLMLQLEDGNQVTTMWQPYGNQMDTEVSIGKDSIGKDSLVKDKKSAKRIYYPEDEKLNDAFNQFIDHRKKMKKPLDEYKAEGQIKKLDKLSKGDPDLAIAIIKQSIDERWIGLFELKTDKQKATPTYVDNNGAIDWSKV